MSLLCFRGLPRRGMHRPPGTLAAFGGGLVTTSDPALHREIRALARELGAPEPRRLAKKVALGHVEALVGTPAGFGLLGRPVCLLSGGSEGVIARYKRGKNSSQWLHSRIHPAWNQTLARTREPGARALACIAQGVDAGIGAVTDNSGGNCRPAARAARQAVHLPAHPGLTGADLERVIRAVEPWL